MATHRFPRCTFMVIYVLLVQYRRGNSMSYKNTSQRFVNTESQRQEQDRIRQYHSYTGGEKRRRSLGPKKCSGNKTQFDYDSTFTCKYDNACFEEFNDCCSDYVSRCGNQTNEGTTASDVSFTCVKMGLFERICDQGTGVKFEGVWMITVCPQTWPLDETKTKCHNPPGNATYRVEDYLPVVAENQFTYRNKHCAICHGMNNYTIWNINFVTNVTPPAKYGLNAKVKFIVENGGEIRGAYPEYGQPRRYCASEKRKTCWVIHELSRSFSNMFMPSEFTIKEIRLRVQKICPNGTVYDKHLKFCRKAYTTSNSDNLSDKFLIAMWFENSSIQYNNISSFRLRFEKALTKSFYLMPAQISNIKFHQQDDVDGFFVATFQLTLTPYQVLILASQRNGILKDISNKSKEFLKLLNFTGDFTFHFGNISRFPVIKMISKQLTCVDGVTLDLHGYKRNETYIVEHSTGKSFSLKDYSVIERGGGKITICRLLLPPGCTNGSYVPLRHNEYIILYNLSLYHTITKRTFSFGEYYIKESHADTNSDKPDNFNNETHQKSKKNLVVLRNGTVLICLPYRRIFTNLTPMYTKNKSRSNFALRILTLIGFSVSIFWLLLLLITYAIFIELRTLPGKNLMNLSISLLLYQCFWLIGAVHSEDTTWCTSMAIFEHYLIIVSFVAMSAISYHSCLVFSNSFAVSKNDKGQRTFLKYSAVVCCCPVIFVTICVIVDRTRTFTVNYGKQCWLGTKNANLFLFLLPIALLLVYNIIAFIRTSISLLRHKKQSQMLQNTKRQNLLICTKLSTLVGFPWIFAFFGVIFHDVVAFEYLFVIFASLQGLYIGVAFLCNAKTLKVYKNRWNKKKHGKAEKSEQGATELRMVKRSTKGR